MYRFGECELDAVGRELRRGGDSVHLEPQAFDLLVYLLDHRDRVVSKIELLEGGWGHQFVRGEPDDSRETGTTRGRR